MTENSKAFWRGFWRGFNEAMRNPLIIAGWIIVSAYVIWNMIYEK